MTLRYKETWFALHQKLGVEICHSHGGQNDGCGTWTYYIYIYERLTPNFDSLWLEDKIEYNCPTHDYYSLSVADVDWHGGITYYTKHGHVKGFRSVQVGCDYSHLWDEEAGFENITLQQVQYDAQQTAEQISKLLHLSDALPQPPSLP